MVADRICPRKRLLIINEGELVRHVKCAGMFEVSEKDDSGIVLDCPKCKHRFSQSEVPSKFAGLPAGVKFNPTDSQLLMHLAAKSGIGNLKPHVLLDEFIPTVGGHDGICYTHPKHIPGTTLDGSSCHVFYRICNAHTKGTQKHRRIKEATQSVDPMVRWHMTGRAKVVCEGTVHRGYKKIFVLHSTSKVREKAVKHNWILHQYHVGESKEELDGQLVAGKIFYQQSPTNLIVNGKLAEPADAAENPLHLLACSTEETGQPSLSPIDNTTLGSGTGDTGSTGCVEIIVDDVEEAADEIDEDHFAGVDYDSLADTRFGDSFPFWNDVADGHPDAYTFETALCPFVPRTP